MIWDALRPSLGSSKLGPTMGDGGWVGWVVNEVDPQSMLAQSGVKKDDFLTNVCGVPGGEIIRDKHRICCVAQESKDSIELTFDGHGRGTYRVSVPLPPNPPVHPPQPTAAAGDRQRSASASSCSYCRLHNISFRDTLTVCTSSRAKRYANFGHSTPTANVPLPDGSKLCSGTTLRALRPCVPPSQRRTKSATSLCLTLVGINTDSSPPSILTVARSTSATC